MVVQCAESVWDIKSVVPGVEVSVEPLVDMHGSMKEVLPGVYHKHGCYELRARNAPPIDPIPNAL